MKQNGIALMVLMLSLVVLTMSSASGDESSMAVPMNRKLMMNGFPLWEIIKVEGGLGQACLHYGAWCGYKPGGQPPCCAPYTCKHDPNLELTCY
ncbi:unnamed protein product [Amaranthus hypochondriacus]